MKVSIITPNYNGVEFLDKYFKSLNQDSDYIGEVIIIDNGSTDSSLDYIKKNTFSFPVVVIENNENLGFAPAVNQGILKSKYDYIFSLNNDTEVKKGSIKAMLDLICDDDVFSVQAKMLQAQNKKLIDDAGDEYNLLGWTKKIGENQNSNNYSQVFEIFSSCAGAALYKKNVFTEIGLFDDNFFAYMEDVDLAIRYRFTVIKTCCVQMQLFIILEVQQAAADTMNLK
jgi:GT2 family glycosyltransferase